MPTSIRVHIWPQTTTISMPAGGTLSKIPIKGSNVIFSPKELPSAEEIKINETSSTIDKDDEICFRTTSTDEIIGRMIDELEPTRLIMKRFIDTQIDNQSESPVESPFATNLLSSRQRARFSEINSQLVSFLWREDMISLASSTHDDTQPYFPETSIEVRLENKLEIIQIKLAAALVGLSYSDTKKLATSALSVQLRNRCGIPVNTISNPFAPYEKVRLNDLIFAKPHTISAPIVEFDKTLQTYWEVGGAYWSELAKTNLYNNDDWKFLVNSGLITEEKNSADISFREILPKIIRTPKYSTPIEMLMSERKLWYQDRYEFETSQKILLEICKVVASSFLGPREGTEENGFEKPEDRTRIAEEVVKNLGLPKEKALGHEIDVAELYKIYRTYVELIITSPPVFKPGGEPRPGYFFKEYILRYPNLGDSLINLTCDELVNTRWMINSDVLGGIKIRPGFSMDNLFPALKIGKSSNLFSEGLAILRDCYAEPFRIEQNQLRLNAWRHEVNEAISPSLNFSPTERFSDLNQEIFNRSEVFRLAVKAASKMEELQGALDNIYERFGFVDSDQGHLGRIEIPYDSTIVAIYAKEGEYAEQQRPLVAFTSSLRRTGRATLTSEIMTATNFQVGVAYIIDGPFCKGMPEFAQWTITVLNVEPASNDSWSLLLEIVPIFYPKKLSSDLIGFPDHLPISSRYCVADCHILENDLVKLVRNSLPRFEVLDIDIITPLF